jgi:hypothetical protein
MITSVKNIMLAAALTAGVSGAFATNAIHKKQQAADLSLYLWQQPEGPPAIGTVSLAISIFACYGNYNLCATGELLLGNGESPYRLYKSL